MKSTEKTYGCSLDEALHLNDGLALNSAGSKAQKYRSQRNSAKTREVPWAISFAEWLDLWFSSGHWADRGRRRGQYVMARNGDAGPYAVGNVSIQLNARNALDSGLKAQAVLASRGRLPAPGESRGWTLVKNGKRPYQVMLGRRHIGRFSCQAEAEAAYAKAWATRRTEVGVSQ